MNAAEFHGKHGRTSAGSGSPADVAPARSDARPWPRPEVRAALRQQPMTRGKKTLPPAFLCEEWPLGVELPSASPPNPTASRDWGLAGLHCTGAASGAPRRVPRRRGDAALEEERRGGTTGFPKQLRRQPRDTSALRVAAQVPTASPGCSSSGPANHRATKRIYSGGVVSPGELMPVFPFVGR